MASSAIEKKPILYNKLDKELIYCPLSFNLQAPKMFLYEQNILLAPILWPQ